MVRTIAVTGATGFVGRAVLAELAADGIQVKALARDPARLPALPGVTAIKGDLHDKVALLQLCQGAQCLLHLAGAISGMASDFQRVNAEGTRLVVAAAEEAGVARLVYVSSLAARAPALSHYGNSKARGEQAVQQASRALQTLIIRPCAVYGEGDTATLPLLKALTSRLAMLPGRADAHFSLIHVTDLARVLVDALASDLTGMREVDDAGGPLTWGQVANVTQALCGRPHRMAFVPRGMALAVGGLADIVGILRGQPSMVSVDKMRQLYYPDWVASGPGWPRKNPISLEEGMKRTLTFHMARGDLPRLPLIEERDAA
jgi:nucleoside-diphosphate-sugar epimerase